MPRPAVAAIAALPFLAMPRQPARRRQPRIWRLPPPAPLRLPARAQLRMGQVQLTFAPVVKRIAPAVVNVYARSVVQVQVNPLFNDPLFSQFFGARRRCASACSNRWAPA